MWVLRVAAFAGGAVLVVGTLLSAVRTFVVPRALPSRLTRFVFLLTRAGFDVVARWRSSYAERDALMALYAPIGLILLPFAWLLVSAAGFTLMFWALERGSWRDAFELAGSSLLTLGFEKPSSVGADALSFVAATVGLGLLALLISYLPTIYAAFARREALVGLLEVRAGRPPSGVAMLLRYHRIRGLDEMSELWPRWEQWFAEVEESHTSLASLPFFRSPEPDRSWVTAAGAVLDAASLVASTLDRPRDPEAELCVRSGYVALRRIADYFDIPYDPDPRRGDPISVSREEYDAAREELRQAGVPLREDVEEAWLDFAGWRVNYDAPLLALAGLTMAPEAPWSSDRAVEYRRPRLLGLRAGR